jgi:hypothetical protein
VVAVRAGRDAPRYGIADLPRRRPHRRGRFLGARRSALGDDGLGIVVAYGAARPSAADYRVTDTDDVRAFLTEVVTLLEETDA